ncbi:MAG: hypothetical protein NC048_02190 [Bacteroides sp.]|nr:hypothetical protein [Bacteroides sp.]
MNTAAYISKDRLIQQTHHGLRIYAHILRQYYPNHILRLKGRDAGNNPNPFNQGKNTLHIFIEKEGTPDHRGIHPDALSPEHTRHHCTDGTIPNGGPLDFAALHYKQNGQELYRTLIQELHLPNPQLLEPNEYETESQPRFSFFKAPVTNTTPYKAITLVQAYTYITGHYAQATTNRYRALLANPDIPSPQARHYKRTQFAYATFSGTFRKRSDQALIVPSGLLCLDFDHVPHVEETFRHLKHDTYFETRLLFRSPGGHGLKWIIDIDLSQATFQDYIQTIPNYIRQTYGLEPDKACKDISRACFLPHDPHAYINEKNQER